MEALEQSLRDINGGRDINEIIYEVDGDNHSHIASLMAANLVSIQTFRAVELASLLPLCVTLLL
ncbi:unnamed protein product [Brassica napus]|uniref:(rape) hypothetical protein n=1 Tax=Brassica napus TaxID=3708 RepID=A0A816IYL8_BRANA|nr:unnamed protein product [Brassica napus]